MNMAGNDWEEVGGKLFKKFKFSNFVESLAFVNKVGELAEVENHHPDINFGWGFAEITLYTHSESAITDKDRKLAISIDKLAS